MALFEMLLFVSVVIGIFTIPFATFAFVRYLRYREALALAEQKRLRPETAAEKEIPYGTV